MFSAIVWRRTICYSPLPWMDAVFMGRSIQDEATWRSGYVPDCKSVYPGSIPGVASNFPKSDATLSPVPDPVPNPVPYQRCSVLGRFRVRRRFGLPGGLGFLAAAVPDLKPPSYPPHTPGIHRQDQKAKRDHPETDNRQKAEHAQKHQYDAQGDTNRL